MSRKIPEGWINTELGAFVSIQGGCAFKSEDFCGSGIPVVRISNINKNGSIDLSDSVFSRYDSSLKRYELSNGDALIAMSGATTGKVGKYKSNELAYINQRVGRFKIGDESRVENDFIYQVASTDHFINSILIDAAGGAQPNISSQQIEAFNVLLPPLPEQQKIATILTSVDTVIEKTRAQIDKLKDLKTGMMQELLTKGIGHTEFKDTPIGRIPKSWDVVELGSISKLERGRFSHRPRNDPKFYNGDNPFLQTGDIPKEAPNITSFSQTLNEKGLKVSKLFPKGTLVITIAATIGEIGILEFDSCFPDSLVGIKVNQTKAKPMFVLYLMRHLKDELESLAPQTAQKNINLDILQPFQIPLPCIEEQELIANSMYSVDIKINTLLKKLERIKNTKKALMQDLLTGKVSVKT